MQTISDEERKGFCGLLYAVIMVDPDNVITEPDETNNAMEILLFVKCDQGK